MTTVSDALHQHAKDDLKRIVERIERLESERADLASDIKDMFSEAKSKGYDTKVLKKLIAIRKKDRNEVATEHELLVTYAHAVGTDLFSYADAKLSEAA